MCVPLTKRKTAIHYPYKGEKQCFTCMLQSVTSALPFQKGGFFIQFSASEDGKGGYDREETIIYQDTHPQSSSSSCLHHFQDRGAIHICLSCTQIPKKNTQFQLTERITAFPYVVLCTHSHINLSPVSCSFIYS